MTDKQIDWYERRNELCPGQVFEHVCGGLVRLDRRVPGDGTQWYVADWSDYAKAWLYEDGTIEPGNLGAMIPDPDRKGGPDNRVQS
jgi:hypothetical protein